MLRQSEANMEVPALCIRLLINILVLLLSAQVQHSCSHKDDAPFLCIVPSRLQLFEYQSVSLNCEGILKDLTEWRVMRKIKGTDTICNLKWEVTGSCTITTAFLSDSGEYWCEAQGKKSNSVNIIVTAGPVILEGPASPVMEGEAVTLHCRNKSSLSSKFTADFYKNGLFIRSSSTGNMTLNSVSMSDEGLYKCNMSGVGESPESHLTVRASSVVLDSPSLPVTEGEAVILHCRNKKTSNVEVDFYKNGLLIRSSSTGNMTIHSVSKSDEGLYKCNISGAGESPGHWLAVRAGSVILESPPPVTEKDDVTLRCRNKKTTTLKADFYKDGLLINTSSTGELTISSVSRSDEGLYKCNISGAGESPARWLTVRELGSIHDDCHLSCDRPPNGITVLRIFVAVLFVALGLLMALLHFAKKRCP